MNWREKEIHKLEGLLKNENEYISGIEVEKQQFQAVAFNTDSSYQAVQHALEKIREKNIEQDRAKKRKNSLVYRLREAKRLLDLHNEREGKP